MYNIFTTSISYFSLWWLFDYLSGCFINDDFERGIFNVIKFGVIFWRCLHAIRTLFEWYTFLCEMISIKLLSVTFSQAAISFWHFLKALKWGLRKSYSHVLNDPVRVLFLGISFKRRMMDCQGHLQDYVRCHS